MARFRSIALIIVGVVLLIAGSAPAYGQFPFEFNRPSLLEQTAGYGVVYRPSDVEYRFVDGDRFDLIYQTGAADMARRTRAALRASWPGTDSLIGPVAPNFRTPVVINNYTDRGNGFVEPFPFRQEIEAVSNKGDPLVARASTWPAVVAPHELVHSAHGDVAAGVGIGGLIRPFAPDGIRALNLTAPRGLVEGVAVYRESHLEPGAGRLHSPRFTMKMKAAMLSDDPWNLTQMLESPAYSQPFNRHYVAGAHAFQFLAERGDSTSTEFFHDVVTWHNRFPFLGFGVWLGASQGQFPGQITDDIRTDLRATYEAEQARRAPFTPVDVISGEDGRNHRRPYWLDDSTLVSYVWGYNERAGFYQTDVSSGERSVIRVQTLTEDRVYTLAPDTSALYASRYVSSPFVPAEQTAEVERIDLRTGDARQLTQNGRALAPVKDSEGRVHVITNDGPFTRWSVLTDGGEPLPVSPAEPSSIRQIAPRPGGRRFAALINAGGDQRIYRARLHEGSRFEIEPWLGLEGAVVYDLCWGPEGRYLLFSADYPEASNIFALDTKADRVLQLARVPFGAFEPTLSPDRSRVAFVNYRHERHDLVTIPFRPDSATLVPDSVVQFGRPSPRASLPAPPDGAIAEESRAYSSWRHLGPRMVFPTLYKTADDWLDVDPTMEGSVGVGLSLAGADPLKRWAYRGTAFWQDGRVWGEARVESGKYMLRPALTMFDRPVRPGIEERGVGLDFRLPISLRSNVYQTFLRFGLGTELRQLGTYGGPYSSRMTLNPSVVFGYRLQQNPRDLVPNTGLATGIQMEYDPWVDAGPAGFASRAALSSAMSVYVPVLRDTHTGVRLGASVLSQNQRTVGTSTFVPRGFGSLGTISTVNRSTGTFARFDAEVTQPLWYIENGSSLVPLYLKALSAYGFGQSMGRLSGDGWREKATSVGAGLSVRARFFYLFDVTMRVGAAYRLGPSDVDIIFR